MSALESSPGAVPSTPAGRHRRAGARPAAGFRPEIEGLRAVAVLLVVANHLGWATGGFVGVDVFFVISGFLITGLLLSEAGRTGRISFVGFYRRRARRILPAALLTLIGTNLAAHAIFLAVRAHQTAVDSWWALGFLANVHFAANGTDYFRAELPPSLVQHFWSLSVEEQFYVVWPVVIAAVLLVSRRIRAGRAVVRPAVFGALAVIVIGSFVWALHETGSAPTRAYFDTGARAWELGAGALLAVTARGLARIPAGLRPLLLLAGGAGLALSAVRIGQGASFPAPAALLPVSATAAIIAAGTGGSAGWAAWPLTNPLSRYVGRISYSMYLCHWPIILCVEASVPRSTAAFYVLVLGGIATVSMISYHLVETPFRTGSIWRLLRALPRGPRAVRGAAVGGRRSGALAAGLVVASVVLGLVWQARPVVRATDLVGKGKGVQPRTISTVAPATPARARAISAAVQADAFPKLEPPLSQLGYGRRVPEWECLNMDSSKVDACVYPRGAIGPKKVALLGDSTAISYVGGLAADLGPRGWRIAPLTMAECPAIGIDVDAESGKAGFTRACADHRTWALEQLGQLRPQLILLTDAANTLKRLSDGATGTAAQREWQRAAAASFAALRRLPWHPRVLVVSSPPDVRSLQSCATAASSPANCVGTPPVEWQELVAAESAAAKTAGVGFVDTHLWFCTPDGLCPAFVGTTPVRWDSTHLTSAYSRSLAPEFDRLLFSAPNAPLR